MCETTNQEIWQRCLIYWCRYPKQIGDSRLKKTATKYCQEDDEILLLLITFIRRKITSKRQLR